MTIPQVSGYGNYLYPYQAYSLPQFNNWNNYGYSTPVFRGAESKPIMQQPLKQDTVQISAEKEIKNKQKEGLSTGAKWAIGLATTTAAVYGCVVGHRMLTKPSIEKVAKNFSEIFRRDVSKEEALKITERYKEIFKIKDKDEFCQKMFEQMKKDYGWEGLNIGCKLYPVKNLHGSESVVAGFKPFSATFSEPAANGSFEMLSMHAKEAMEIATKRSRSEIFSSMMHEFQHCKQHELIYRADKQKFIDSMIKARLSPDMKEEISLMKKCIDDIYEPCWGKMSKLAKGSEEYNLAIKYRNNLENYISATKETRAEYLAQIVEKEAHNVGTLADEAYNFFANPWRIF